MTIKEARAFLVDWMVEEFDYYFTDDAELGEDNTQIAIGFSQYDDGEVVVDEQWYADLVNKELYCELNGVPCIKQKFQSLDELTDNINYGWLIGEADYYIEEHKNDFKEGE